MATFVKLTNLEGGPTWVNLDLVRCMWRVAPRAGTSYSDQNDDGTWREYVAGAKPERTELSFRTSAFGYQDSAEVLETPDEVLLAVRRQP